ncbi:MAG: hypothetical protein ACPG3T_02810 [Pseudomonadales bacterium]
MLDFIKKKLSSFFEEPEFDESRRRVIRNAAGLAALCALSPLISFEDKVKSIQDKINSGLIDGEDFFIYEPVVINIPDVHIRNCRFTAMADMPYMIMLGNNTARTVIDSVYIDESRFKIGSAIYVDVGSHKGSLSNISYKPSNYFNPDSIKPIQSFSGTTYGLLS